MKIVETNTGYYLGEFESVINGEHTSAHHPAICVLFHPVAQRINDLILEADGTLIYTTPAGTFSQQTGILQKQTSFIGVDITSTDIYFFFFWVDKNKNQLILAITDFAKDPIWSIVF
jgi:hypothetical protein